MNFNSIFTSISKTFAILLAMFCFGVLIGPFAIGVSTMMFVILLTMTMFVGIFLPVRSQRLIALCIFLFFLGVFRYQQSEIPKNIPTVRDHVGEVVRVEGIVNAEPTTSTASQQVTIGSVRVSDEPVFGNMLVSIPKDQQIAYGDQLIFTCTVQIPRAFSGFAYDRYLQAKGTLALCRSPHNLYRTPFSALLHLEQSERSSGEFDREGRFLPLVEMKQVIIGSILSLKHNIVGKMRMLFPEPHASFLFGLVFGGNIGLDKDIVNDFAKTGTSHILAASGFNVSLFTFVFFGFIIQYLGKKRGAIVTAILLVAYVIMAGATAAVVRAAIFGAVLLVGSVIGRRASIVNTLLFTASMMLMWNPRWLFDDVGFQLSFVAFAAIIFIAPEFEKHLEFIPKRFGIRDALAGSLSAIILTLPIMLWQFGSFSLMAPFANVFVLPIVPFLMLYTICILPFAWISMDVAKWIALPSLIGSKYMLGIISIFASPTFASVSVPSAHLVAITTAVFIGIGCIAYFRKT